LEVDVQQGNFKILRLLPQVLILFLLEKWISPTMPEIAKFGQKTQGILGDKKRVELNPPLLRHPSIQSYLLLPNSIFFFFKIHH
jgi:hypothetical protein